MKKFIITLMSAFFILSCSDDHYENLNRDPNNPTIVSSASLFTAATKSLVDEMVTPNYNTNAFRYFSQYWTATTYTDEANYDLITRNVSGNYWTELYMDVLYDLKDAKAKAAEESTGADLANKQAMIEVLEVYTWQNLVDAFGNIPYTDALKGSELPSPKYDDAKTIYQDLFKRIDAAIASMNVGASGYSEADVIYQGNMAKWKKFANGVKLRLAMRVADVSDMSATSKAKAQEAFASGLFISNSDNADTTYSGATPNPIWSNLVESGRDDNVIANTIVDYMNSTSDPRRYKYFAENLGANIFVGGPYGKKNEFGAYTHVNQAMIAQDYKGVLMDYAEVQFMLAQAAAMGYAVGGTAEAYYTAGITASMKDWGVSDADTALYLAKPDVAYATATGDWRAKIGKQFWLAMYNRGFEGWTVWRQFNSPALNIPAISKTPVPLRMTYPVSEQNLNKANWEAASTAIGGDKQQTKLFWDTL